MYRVGLFWEAWLGEVRAAEDPSVVPGEIDSGIGRFVRGIAGGEADVASLPVTEEQMADGGVVFAVDPAPTAEQVARFVPSPRAPAVGVRTRARPLAAPGPP